MRAFKLLEKDTSMACIDINLSILSIPRNILLKQLHIILCQLINCQSFEIFAILSKARELDNGNFRLTDLATMLLDTVTRASTSKS